MIAPSTGGALHAYHCYGFDLVSNLPLPHLPAGRSTNSNVTVDFVETAGPIVAAPIDVSDRLARIAIPGWARFEVRDGRQIRIEASLAATREAGLLLLGAPLAALLYQRGQTVVRGGVVSRGDRQVLLIGAGGSGVSTLLATLLEQGWDVQCDALVAIDRTADGPITALPGLPSLKLWRDASERLGEVRGLDECVRAGSSCRWVRFDERHIGRRVNPTCVVELGLWNRGLLAETLSRRHGLERLLGCRYHPVYGGRLSAARDFATLTALAGSIRIGRLLRSWRPFDPRAQLEPFADLTDRLHDRSGGWAA
ncbi:MAG: hypothetical protein ABI868_08345 [Acidobacteriota bacterium]